MTEHSSNRHGRRVLVVMDTYLPGRLAGGPVTSVVNMIEALGDDFDFTVVTRNSDLNGEVYPEVPLGTPVQVGRASVIYLAAQDFTPGRILRLAASLGANSLYLNSFFSVTTIRLLLRLRLGASRLACRIVLAPRGEFSPGALGLKAGKKQAYLRVFGWLGLSRVVHVFQASSPLEERDIYRTLGPVPVRIAADIPDTPQALPGGDRPDGRRLVFVSRISPKKNLHFALQLLRGARGPTDFDIYGPLEDQAYWQECQRVMETLPPHVRVTYRGLLKHEDVRATFSCYSAFLFPTQGENYGHVIFEALSGGCPVVLSDQTPWQDLEAQEVGWICDLGRPDQFLRAVDEVLSEPEERAQARRERCVAYARRVAGDPSVREDNRRLFAQAPGEAHKSGARS